MILTGVQTTTPTAPRLPKEITVRLTNVGGSLPTHMLAVYPRNDKPNSRITVTLYHIHDIALTAHCAHLPKLPPSTKPAGLVAPGTLITIPVIPFAIPHLKSFTMLTAYLYNKRSDVLLSQLFPLRPEVGIPTANGPSRHLQYATSLARTYTIHALYKFLMVVNG